MPQPLPDLMALSTYDDNLRQIPVDVVAIEAAIATARGHLAATPSVDAAAMARLESYTGEALRILGRHAEAIGHHERAVAQITTAPNRPPELAYQLRLAETLRCAGDHSAAETGMRTGLAAARSDPELASYEAFASSTSANVCRIRGDSTRPRRT